MKRIDPELVARFSARAGAASTAKAEGALGTTLHVLAASLPRALVERLASELPAGAAALVRGVAAGEAATARSLFATIQKRDRLPEGRAVEAGEVACAVIAEALSPELRARLGRELDPELAALLSPPEPPAAAKRARPTAPGGKLSTGRAGAARPLASSQPAGPRAHEHRLAASRGTRQEEAGETLARGAPKPKRKR